MDSIRTFLDVYSDSIPWGEQLAVLPTECRFAPMRPGGWSIGECLAHLTAWDRFVLTERLSKVCEGAELGGGPDAGTFNAEAAAYARSGIGEQRLIEEFVETRRQMLQAVERLLKETGEITFTIRGHRVVFPEYLLGQAEHHLHHRQQIDEAAEAAKSL